MIVYEQQTRPGSHGKSLIVLNEEQAEYYDNEGGSPERNVVDWVRSWIPKTKTFVDVGAHAGTWALTLSDEVPCVVAFEANYRTFCQLAGGVALNDLAHKVAIHRCAISDANLPKVILRSISADRGGTSIVALPTYTVESVEHVEEVESCTLDSFALTNVGFVKIDVEGAEINVLRGALATLERSGWPTILFESWNPELRGEWAKPIREELFAFLDSIGYRLVNVTGQSELFIAEAKSKGGST